MVSLAITFALVFIMINILGNMLDKVMQASQLSLINKLAGAFFNICKVMLIVGILLLFIDKVGQPDKHTAKKCKGGVILL